MTGRKTSANASSRSWTSTSTRPRRPSPNRPRRPRPRAAAGSGCPSPRELKAEAAGRGLWNLFLTGKAAKAVTSLDPTLLPDPPLTNLQYAPLAEITGWSPALAPGSAELRRARYRQHGTAGRVRLAGTAGTLAPPAARGHDQVGVLHDRAGRRLQRRVEHRHHDHQDRRRLRDQRPQVVVIGRAELGLQDLHRDGSDRRGAPPERDEPRTALHDPGAARHPGGRGQARDAGVRLHRRDARRPRRGRLHRRARPGREPHRRRGRGVRDRAGAAGPRPHPPLHAADRRGRARPGAHVPARDRPGPRSASRWPSRA